MGHLVRRTRVIIAGAGTTNANMSNEDDIIVFVPYQGTSSYATLWLPENPVVGQTHSIVVYEEDSFIHTLSLNTPKHRFGNYLNHPGDAWDLMATGKRMTLVYAEVPSRLNNIPGSDVLNGSPLGLCGSGRLNGGPNSTTLTNFNNGVMFTGFNIKPGDTLAVYPSFGPPTICYKRRVLSVDSDNQITLEYIGFNTAVTDLSGNMTVGAGSLGVVSTAGFPSSAPYTIRIDNETMVVNSVVGNTLYVTRGMSGTVAASHTSGADVYVGYYWQLFIDEGLWFPINI